MAPIGVQASLDDQIVRYMGQRSVGCAEELANEIAINGADNPTKLRLIVDALGELVRSGTLRLTIDRSDRRSYSAIQVPYELAR